MKETPDQAAHHAADREGFPEWRTYWRDLYVRAFLAGARWEQTQEFEKVCQSVEIINRDAVIAHMQKRLDDYVKG